MKEKKKLRNIINIALVFIFSFGMIFFIVKDDFNDIVDVIKSAKWLFLVMGITFQVLQQLTEGVIIMVLSRQYRRDYTFKEGFVNNLVGLFFSFITPSATGGQFAQAYVFDKQGIKVEKSASLMIVNFIAYETSIILYSLLAIITSFSYLNSLIGDVNLLGIKVNFTIIVIIGFCVNVLSIVGILLLSYSKIANALIKLVVKILAKLKIVKDYNYRMNLIDQKVTSFRNNLSDIRHYWKRFLAVVGLTIVKLTIFYIAPFFVALALGVEVGLADIFTIIILAACVNLVATFIPIPGSSGGAEFFFYIMMAPIFISNDVLSAAMILWRTITFYIPLIYTSLATIFFNRDRKVDMLDTVIPLKYQWFFNALTMTEDMTIKAEEYIDEIDKTEQSDEESSNDSENRDQ